MCVVCGCYILFSQWEAAGENYVSFAPKRVSSSLSIVSNIGVHTSLSSSCLGWPDGQEVTVSALHLTSFQITAKGEGNFILQ